MQKLHMGIVLTLFFSTMAQADPQGLIVCIGTEAIEQNSQGWETPGCIIQCLSTDATEVTALRQRIQAAAVYGKVTARLFDGMALPYIDNSVNSLVCTDAQAQCSRAEILRVLAPHGTARVKGQAIRKPRPAGLDDWTHYQYDPTGTMVGGDTVVGPPRRLQWLGHPKWLRNHDFMTCMHAMVSCNGRIFYIIDEGLRKHITLPSDWQLICRDAFNGTILWKQALKDWQPRNWPLKSGPGDLPRRIVATADRVYTTAGLIEPLTAYDARTGRILRTYAGTDATIEILHSDGALFLLCEPGKQPVGFRVESETYSEIKRANSTWAWKPQSPKRVIKAVDAVTGKIRWEHAAKVAPLTLTVNDTQVFFHNGNALQALDRKNGQAQWASEPVPVKSVATGGALRVAYAEGVTVFAQGVNMTSFDARSGRTLWQERLQKTSHHCPEDLFIIDGQIWSPNTGKPQQNGTHFKVFDLHTGKINRDFVAENLKGFPMHPRCYPSRATERFIMTNGMGTEFYEIGSTKVDINNTVRGSCIYGVMPANGLLYKPPDTCACYYQSKLEYLCALAPAERSEKSEVRRVKVENRLEKGPAYGRIHPSAFSPQPSSWPMYRRDIARSGHNPTPASTKLQQAWKVELGGPSSPGFAVTSKLTQPVVAAGKMVVSAVDAHTIYALDAQSGQVLWRFTAGGRVDSSPTLHRGTVLFGCTDGWVYCLRLGDGALVWRYLVAPDERQLVAFQQLESVWPVHGSLLVHNNMVYCLAGRNMFFDGGLRLALLDPATGRELSAHRLDENDPATGQNLQTLIQTKYMPVANVDLFSCNGTNLFMQTQKFDLQGRRINIAPILPGKETPDMAGDQHLFCQTGFLDDNWFHRSYWIYGNNCGEGWGDYFKPRYTRPAGRLVVFDETKAYAFRSEILHNRLNPRQSYTLYAVDKDPPLAEARPAKGKTRRGKTRLPGFPPSHWQKVSPELLVNAMALGADVLFVAGPPDLADETKMTAFLPGADDAINHDIQAQEAAWRGQRGGLLWAVNAKTGQKIAEARIDTYPVFDGLAVAEGKLYMSMLDGTVRCYR